MEPTKQKLTGLNSINATLSRGSFGEQVKALQQYLIGLGYANVKADGVFGPQTEIAVKQYQLDNGLKGDGVWGPISQQKALVIGGSPDPAGAPGTGKAPDDSSFMFNAETGKINDKYIPKTQKELDQYYNAYAASHPVFAGNDPDTLAYASETGDFSVLVDGQGQPFSNLQQKDAMRDAEDALRPGFEAEKRFDTGNIESDLADVSRSREEFLAREGENFKEDKTNLDQNAAEKGVLFSGGRIEKEKKLQNAYNASDAANRAQTASSIGNIARSYQYAYGDKAAKNPSLSQYYQLAGNTYNANTARDNVGRSPLMEVYSGRRNDFQGTKVNANKSSAQVRAANLLKNRGNKLFSSGLNNQF